MQPDEKFDNMKKVVDGTFNMGSTFMIVIITQSDDDDVVANIL